MINRHHGAVDLVEEHASDHGPDQEDHGIQPAGCNSHSRCAWTPSRHGKAHAKDQTADDLGSVHRGQKVDLIALDHPYRHKEVQPEHGRNHGREHDLEDGHIAEVEDAGQLPGAAEPG